MYGACVLIFSSLLWTTASYYAMHTMVTLILHPFFLRGSLFSSVESTPFFIGMLYAKMASLYGGGTYSLIQQGGSCQYDNIVNLLNKRIRNYAKYTKSLHENSTHPIMIRLDDRYFLALKDGFRRVYSMLVSVMPRRYKNDIAR